MPAARRPPQRPRPRTGRRPPPPIPRRPRPRSPRPGRGRAGRHRAGRDATAEPRRRRGGARARGAAGRAARRDRDRTTSRPRAAPAAAAVEPLTLPPPDLPAEAATLAAPAAAFSAAEAAPEEGCAAAQECECAKPRKNALGPDAGRRLPGLRRHRHPLAPLVLAAARGRRTTTVFASHGYRAGVSLVPFYFPVTPTLTFNYGRAFESDWVELYGKFATPDPDLEPVLRKFGYQYVDAHVGLELGSARRFGFFLRAGLTQLWTTVHGLTPAAAAQLDDMTATVADTKVTARVPSLKLGFLIYFF